MILKLTDLLTNTAGLSFGRIVLALIMVTLLTTYIFFIYRVVTKNAFYSKSFNLTMALMGLITASIIIAMQSNLVVSLGMVGALSIIRFRTAIKDPMDLLFLFWSISNGIICGTELYGLAIILSILVSVTILSLDMLPVKKAPFLLILNSEGLDSEAKCLEIIDVYAKKYKLKSKNISKRGLDMVFEIRTEDPSNLVLQLNETALFSKISLVSYDGETRF